MCAPVFQTVQRLVRADGGCGQLPAQKGKQMREKRRVRAIPSEFTTREDGDNLTIEGYFAVFNSIYEIAPGLTESVAPGAFENTISGDIRALINHDTTLVLGRTKAHTLELREDERGLWGKVTINANDRSALDLYERVKRGDVDGCSFGFDIVKEDVEISETGDVHWTIREVILYEVSCCTFPAYEETNISAREKQLENIRKRDLQAWQEKMKERLKNGA